MNRKLELYKNLIDYIPKALIEIIIYGYMIEHELKFINSKLGCNCYRMSFIDGNIYTSNLNDLCIYNDKMQLQKNCQNEYTKYYTSKTIKMVVHNDKLYVVTHDETDMAKIKIYDIKRNFKCINEFEFENSLYVLDSLSCHIVGFDEYVVASYARKIKVICRDKVTNLNKPQQYDGWDPAGLAIINNKLYVSDYINHCVHIYDYKHNKYISSFGSYGLTDSKFIFPCSMAVYANYLYICDSGNNSIKVYDENSIFIKSFTVIGDIKLCEPENMLIIHDKLWLTDNSDLHIFGIE